MAGIGAALIWAGCSVERDYKVLSFFFDGVPDPTLIANAADALRFAKATGGKVYAHVPFARNQCGECHTNLSGESITDIRTTVCLRCHEAVTNQHEKMHGAVAAAACLFCHTPHESTIEHLLRTDSPKMCTQCHAPAMFGDPPAPVHQDLNRNCGDCHYAHGGPERFFLREGWNTAVPASASPSPATGNEPAADAPSSNPPPSGA